MSMYLSTDMSDREEQVWSGSENGSAHAPRFGRKVQIATALAAVLTLALGALWAAPGVWAMGVQKTQKLYLAPSQPGMSDEDYQQRFQTVTDPLAPCTDKNDGNFCYDDEEYFEGLCYKKCALLEPGFPIRTTAFSCCSKHPCGIANQRVKVAEPCHGFDVSGDAAGCGCPHSPGACLKDEELYLDKCYKKCSILTKSKYPFRHGPSTCCKKESTLFCMFDIFADKTDPEFNVGGGVTAEERVAHDPLTSLTEGTR